MIIDNTSKSSLVTCFEVSIPNEKGMDDFDQILSLKNTFKSGDK